MMKNSVNSWKVFLEDNHEPSFLKSRRRCNDYPEREYTTSQWWWKRGASLKRDGDIVCSLW